MSWFFIALVGPALWAANNHIDKYLLSRLLKDNGPGALFIFSALASTFVAPLVFLAKPTVLFVTATQALAMGTVGVLGILGFFFYFYALQKNDASTVVPFFQLQPVIALVLAFIFLQEIPALPQILGMFLVVAGGFLLSLEMVEGKTRFKASMVVLMVIASLALVSGSVLFKSVALASDYWTATFWSLVGTALIGFIFLLYSPYRHAFLGALTGNTALSLTLNGLNEAISLTAGLIFSFATLLAPLALVQGVNAAQPLFVLAYGILLTFFFPHISEENLSRRHVVQKVLAIILMAVGVYFIF